LMFFKRIRSKLECFSVKALQLSLILGSKAVA
jgi:hypothetical protein